MFLCSISMYKCSVCEALWAAVAEGALYKIFIIIIVIIIIILNKEAGYCCDINSL